MDEKLETEPAGLGLCAPRYRQWVVVRVVVVRAWRWCRRRGASVGGGGAVLVVVVLVVLVV